VGENGYGGYSEVIDHWASKSGGMVGAMGSTRVWVAMRANSLRRFAANRCIQAKCVLGPSLGHRRSVPRLSTRRPASCSPVR